MARTKNYYLTSDQIYDEWKKWKDSSPNIEDRVIGEKLGEYMISVATHLSQGGRFNRYPPDVRGDMIQEGVLKMMKNLKNMKEEYRKSFFAYFTRCAWTAFIVYLRDYYKEVNLKRELIVETLLKAKDENQIGNDELIRRLSKELEDYSMEVE